MGSTISSLGTSAGRKRKHSECEDEDGSQTDEEAVVDVVKRKKLKGTCDYIYQTLFLDGEGSDVTIHTLGKEWKLHRIYMCQSAYFQSMFNGSWKESTADHITMEIPDENIDVEALNTAFGSLYCDEVMVSPVKVVPLLAAANLLQLEGLSQQCAEAMIETINRATVCAYHVAATQYCETEVQTKCVKWLERRLTSETSVSLLKEISVELMSEVVNSQELFVMQIEVDVYNLLKVWAYLHLHPNWEGSWKDVRAQSNTYFASRATDSSLCFLETDEGRKFVPAFRAIRLHHVVNDIRSIQLLDTDRIIPQDWLHPVYKSQWVCMLSVSQNRDSSPSIDKFRTNALRCGRILERNSSYCWRWTGFSYGIDVIVTYSPRMRQLLLRRNTYTHPVSGAVFLHQQKNIIVRVAAASFDAKGCTSYYTCSGLLDLTLDPDEEKVVLQLDRSAVFPLSVSVHMAHVSCSATSIQSRDEQ